MRFLSRDFIYRILFFAECSIEMTFNSDFYYITNKSA